MSTEIGRARYTFDRFGYVPDGIISPMILRSWERSKQLSREVRSPKLTPEEFSTKLKENADFLAAAEPIAQLLYTCSLRTMVGLSASDTIMIHQISADAYMNQLGRGGSEEVIGTTATNLCLMEGIPVQTVRQENYALRYQHCSFAAAPVYGTDREAVGAISFITTFGTDLHKDALLMVTHGAKLIEQRLSSRTPLPLLSCGGINAILDLCEQNVLICDDRGCICASNKHSRKALGVNGLDAIHGHQICELMDSSQDTEKIIEQIKTGVENLELSMVGKRLKFLFHEEISSGAGDGSKLYALVFELAVQPLSFGVNSGKSSITDLWMPAEGMVSIIGESPAWLRVKRMIQKVASVRSARVLIEGESGTGKEQIAKAIHAASGRKGKMITLNCGALPKELLQSELFGYVDGAFTGAKKGGNPGKFEMANGGTLFLDEIGEMPLDMQVSLLRVLEERQVVRLGSSKPIAVDLTIVAATNKHLMSEVAAGNFREDLYYRLSAVVISAPPLRERKSDIPLLSRHLIGRLAESMCINPKEISEDAMQALLEHSWPGNVRELLNVLEHALVMEEDELISRDTLAEVLDIRALPVPVTAPNQVVIELDRQEDLRSYTEKSKAETILQVVNECGGNISRAAKQLNVSRNTIYRYLGKK